MEKKLDKRGLLDLGYGYGINGLDVGYLGGGHAALHSSLGLGGHIGNGWQSHGLQGYGQSHGLQGYGQSHGWHGYGNQHESFLGGHVDTLKTVTLVKGVPVPVERPVAVPYPVVKHVGVPVQGKITFYFSTILFICFHFKNSVRCS